MSGTNCEHCAALIEQNQALQERAVDDHEKIAALNQALVDAARKSGRLQAELTKMERADAPPALVKYCFERWADGQPGRPRLGPARTDLIGKALNAKWGGRERVLRAIRGGRAYPFVVDGQRVGRGPRNCRHDRLGLILADEECIEKFGRLAWRADLANGVIRPGQVPDAVPLLVAEFGEDRVFDPYGDELWWIDPNHPEDRWWLGPCPACDAWMRVSWLDGGGTGLECLGGCGEAVARAALEALSEPVQREPVVSFALKGEPVQQTLEAA